MTGTFDSPPPPRDASRPTPAERAAVLGGFAFAALYTAVAAVSGAGMDIIGAAWLAAVAWAAVSSLALALRRGLRHGDWSAFGRYRLPDDRDEQLDFATRTGMYAWLRDEEDRLLHEDDDWLR